MWEVLRTNRGPEVLLMVIQKFWNESGLKSTSWKEQPPLKLELCLCRDWSHLVLNTRELSAGSFCSSDNQEQWEAEPCECIQHHIHTLEIPMWSTGPWDGTPSPVECMCASKPGVSKPFQEGYTCTEALEENWLGYENLIPRSFTLKILKQRDCAIPEEELESFYSSFNTTHCICTYCWNRRLKEMRNQLNLN